MGFAGSDLSGGSVSAGATIGFATTDTLNNGAAYDSPVLVYSTDDKSQVQTEVLASHDGTMLFRFYADDAGTDLIRSLTVPYSAADGYRLFAAPTFGQSVRYRFTNDSGSNQTDFYFTTKLITKALSPQLLAVDAFLSPAMIANVSRSVVAGADSQGNYRNVQLGAGDTLGVSIINPTEAFGAVLVSDLHPVIQRKWVNGRNDFLDEFIEHEGGNVSFSNGQVVLSSSTTTSSRIQYYSRKVVSYRPGQAVVIRFTAAFTAGAAGTRQYAGIGDPESGLGFGYDGTSFGVVRRTGGQVEIRKLTVTGAPSGAGTVTVTLNGTGVNTVLDGTETIAETAWKIAQSDYSDAGGGWRVRYQGDEVWFMAIDTDTRGGSYSFAAGASGSTATEAQVAAASAATDTWTAQTSWSDDQADGTKDLPSLDFTKGNVFEIQYQWLGYGEIFFRVENPSTGRYVTVHKIAYPGTAVVPSIQRPDMPLCIEADNGATTSDMVIKVGSMAALKAGELVNRQGVRFAHSREVSTDNTRVGVFAIRFNPYFSSQTSKIRAFVDGFTLGNNSSNRTATVEVWKNLAITGAPTWTSVDSSNSVIQYSDDLADIDDTTGQPQYTNIVGSANGYARTLEPDQVIELEPGDILVFTTKLASGGASAGQLAGCTWVEIP